MTDTPEIARIRAVLAAWFLATCMREEQEAKSDLREACTVDAMTSVLVHIAAQAAEVERLRADAARYQWLRRNSVKLSLPNDTLAALVRDQAELDVAMKEQPCPIA